MEIFEVIDEGAPWSPTLEWVEHGRCGTLTPKFMAVSKRTGITYAYSNGLGTIYLSYYRDGVEVNPVTTHDTAAAARHEARTFDLTQPSR